MAPKTLITNNAVTYNVWNDVTN